MRELIVELETGGTRGRVGTGFGRGGTGKIGASGGRGGIVGLRSAGEGKNGRVAKAKRVNAAYKPPATPGTAKQSYRWYKNGMDII